MNVIKLEGTFLEGALINATDRTVMTAIVQMSNRLGLRTIGDGVERPEQHQFLDAIHADSDQGYLYQRPVPAAALATWLTDNVRGHPQPSAGLAIPSAPAPSP